MQTDLARLEMHCLQKIGNLVWKLLAIKFVMARICSISPLIMLDEMA